MDLTKYLLIIYTAALRVLEYILSDILLMTLFCGSIVTTAAMFIRKVKRAAR